MKIIRSDCDGDATYRFVKEKMARFNLDEELLEALTELLDRGVWQSIVVEPSVREFLKNDDALSANFHIFKHGGIVDGERAIPFIEFSPALMKVLSHMRDILEMNVKKPSNTGSNGQKS